MVVIVTSSSLRSTESEALVVTSWIVVPGITEVAVRVVRGPQTNMVRSRSDSRPRFGSCGRASLQVC